MPRVALTTEQRKNNKVKDLAGWVVSQMHILGMKQDEVAKELGISQPAFSIRINVKSCKKKDPFSYGDMLILFKLFETSDEEMIRLMRM